VNAKTFVSSFLGLAVIAALLLLDHWVFATWLNASYLEWYLAAGSVIGLVTAVAAMAWGDLEKHPGLIAAHPLDYLGSCLQLVGLPLVALGTLIGTGKAGTDRIASATRTLNLVLTTPLILTLVALLIGWLLVIVPAQYVITLVCGAPSRVFAESTREPIARLKGHRLETSGHPPDAEIPQGWWAIGFGRKPVAVTNLFASLVFLVIRLLS